MFSIVEKKINTTEIHKGNAMFKVNCKSADDVNTYGANPINLLCALTALCASCICSSLTVKIKPYYHHWLVESYSEIA